VVLKPSVVVGVRLRPLRSSSSLLKDGSVVVFPLLSVVLELGEAVNSGCSVTSSDTIVAVVDGITDSRVNGCSP
jgi:hypothetical protein